MGPEDATNLLLAVMYDGELADAHLTVERLRSAELAYFEGRRSFDAGGEKMTAPPRNGFITSAEGDTYRLGTVIDILLDAWVRYASIDESNDEDDDLEPVNVSLTISSPGYEANLTFNTPCGLFWRLRYEWKSPEQVQYEAERKGSLVCTRWDAREGPAMSSSRWVGEDSLTKIADCLRGFAWDDDNEAEVSPPYATELSCA